ncbi:hypothetical protein Tco_0641653 [Tanacetum coccineum]
MEMEPDIENMTMNEYLEYEDVKERQLWDDDSIWEQDDDLEEDQKDDENVIQPLIPKTLHTIRPNEDYVAPATKSILDYLLEEFEDEILNVTMVDEGAKCNPAKDLKELERLLAKEPELNFKETHVHSIIINTEPFIHTKLMSSLYGVFKTSKPCKVDRETISLGRYAFYSSFPYLVAYLHPKGVYCYFHPYLILSEGMETRVPSK